MYHHVAVIGAGAAGLVAARELRRAGHMVVVFERTHRVGGIWAYDDKTETDHLSRDPNRVIVHSSLYRSLRTNIPREIMGFKDFPFLAKPESGDSRRYPRHEEVLAYLIEFSRQFGLDQLLRLETEVVQVERLPKGRSGGWKVMSRSKGCENEEVYDAVVVCNGHYTEPRLANVPGIGSWPGKQMHSHNYRVPEPFEGQVVVLIGNSSSAVDISRELAGVAKEVHVAAWGIPDETFELLSGYENLWLHSSIEKANEDGSLIFRNQKVVVAHVVMHCTGYKFHFPFLKNTGFVRVDDNRVEPLYKHVFPPDVAPWLSFVGLPSKIAPFILFELQSKWVAGVLSGRIPLPSQDQMMEDVTAFYQDLEASNVPKRHTHYLGSLQTRYNDWLAEECGCSGMEKWREAMYFAASKGRKNRPDTYRDEWEDDDLVTEAYEDFNRITSANSSPELIRES